MWPDLSGPLKACKVAPKVMIRALTPFAPVRTTDSTGAPSGMAPNGSRRAVAALAEPAIIPAPTKPTIAFLQLILAPPQTKARIPPASAHPNVRGGCEAAV